MLAGEYVVLDGALALVAAVGRRATANWAPARNDSRLIGRNSAETGPLPPEALLARTLAERRLHPVPHALTLDVSALRSGDRKLGLGSSAAGAAAVAGAVFAFAGRDITRPDVRREVLDVALEGHQTVAPQGSGADVAASVLGGFVRFRRLDAERVEAEPTPWPIDLHARVVWTGTEARTSELVARVRELEASNPSTYADRMGTLRAASEAMVEAFTAGDARRVVEATGTHHRAMAALGDAAGAPIVESRLEQVAELARAAGGAAKPSGAGGGDVSIAFFADDSATESFDDQCRNAGLTPVELRLGAEGTTPLSAAS